MGTFHCFRLRFSGALLAIFLVARSITVCADVPVEGDASVISRTLEQYRILEGSLLAYRVELEAQEHVTGVGLTKGLGVFTVRGDEVLLECRELMVDGKASSATGKQSVFRRGAFYREDYAPSAYALTISELTTPQLGYFAPFSEEYSDRCLCGALRLPWGKLYSVTAPQGLPVKYSVTPVGSLFAIERYHADGSIAKALVSPERGWHIIQYDETGMRTNYHCRWDWEQLHGIWIPVAGSMTSSGLSSPNETSSSYAWKVREFSVDQLPMGDFSLLPKISLMPGIFIRYPDGRTEVTGSKTGSHLRNLRRFATIARFRQKAE